MIMASSKRVDVPDLGAFEKADLQLVKLNLLFTSLFAAFTGVFRGKASPRYYRHHIQAATIRAFTRRMSARQQKFDTYSPPCKQH